jgi:pyruvate,orthophosphate dikinase
LSARRELFHLGGGSRSAAVLGPEDVGAKAHVLMRLAGLGLPVPPAFGLTTGWCRAHLAGRGATPGLDEALAAGIARLEEATGRSFGSMRRPLVVSVRSGAPVSMPGMMETVLNVGLSDKSVRGLIRATGNPRLAWDSYRRLVLQFAEVVAGCPSAPFEELHRQRCREAGVEAPRELDAEELAGLTGDALALFRELAGRPFPQAAEEQLRAAVEAVFRSWTSPQAAEYRRLHGLDDLTGTAVLVQAMVFGNAGGTSGSGVAFTRDPATGAPGLYLDFLFNAQGEDIVSGRRAVDGEAERLAATLPGVEARLREIAGVLERELGDLQDIEFTAQEGELYVLQSRPGKRTPWAALQIAVALVREGVIDVATALERLAPYDLDAIERLRLAAEGAGEPLARATSASLGVASGAIALDSEAARAMAASGRSVILVREQLATEDLPGLVAASGVLTASGGRTSHAAVVARQLGKVCLVGCRDLTVRLADRRVRVGERQLSEGALVSLDGDGGRVYEGELRVIRERPVEALAELASWRPAAGV